MARINIENGLFIDGRYQELLIRLGSKHEALGVLVHAFMVAQKYWYPDRKPIPQDVYEREGLPIVLIDVGLARHFKGGIYVSGSETQFAWLFAAATNGSKGGKSYTERRKNRANTPSKPNPGVSQLKPLTLPLTLSTKEENTYVENGSGLSPDGDAHPLVSIWNIHCGNLAKVRAIGSKRRRAAEARWREHPSTEYWGEVVRRIAASPFCTGRGKTSWRATFDFLIQPETQNKVLEGAYDEKKPEPEFRVLNVLRDGL